MRTVKVVVAQLGARKHYQEPVIFQHWGILEHLYTDFYSGDSVFIKILKHSSIHRHLPNFLKKALERYDPGLKNAKVTHFPKFCFQYTEALKQASSQESSKIFVWGGKEFCRLIIEHGLEKANTIYGFNSACYELFTYAKPKGIRCILDQTLADYSLVHQILLEEEERWQQWSLTPFTVSDADLELLQREHQEQNIADDIICGSSFVKDSLIARGVEADKISVVPLGRLKDEISLAVATTTQTPKERGDGLRILFVGSVNLRKGIPYLLTALKQIQGTIPFTCKVVGSLEIKPERVTEYSNVCEFLGRIPRSQVKDLYAWADVFVLPSLCEGSAMVTYEALSLGVPVITTYNSGSIARDSIDGFIVPIRDSNAIADKLLKFYTQGDSGNSKANTQEYLKNVFAKSEQTLQQLLFNF